MYYGQCEKCEWLTSSLIWNNHCLFIQLKRYNLATLKRLVNCSLMNLLYYCSHFNPFGPKSDQHLFSPNNISRSSRVKVTRITEFIIKGTGILNQILSTILKRNVWRSVWRICMWILKALTSCSKDFPNLSSRQYIVFTHPVRKLTRTDTSYAHTNKGNSRQKTILK